MSVMSILSWKCASLLDLQYFFFTCSLHLPGSCSSSREFNFPYPGHLLPAFPTLHISISAFKKTLKKRVQKAEYLSLLLLPCPFLQWNLFQSPIWAWPHSYMNLSCFHFYIFLGTIYPEMTFKNPLFSLFPRTWLKSINVVKPLNILS